jgi:hypothetical protein
MCEVSLFKLAQEQMRPKGNSEVYDKRMSHEIYRLLSLLYELYK